MLDIKELREELLENAMDYLDERHQTQKCFAKMFFKHKLTQGISIDNYTNFMPQMYAPQEAIELARAMEMYVMGNNK